jgi:hypothetical protein
MKRTDYKDDPIAYRIGYSRIAQTLHQASVDELRKSESRRLCGRKRADSKDEPSETVAEMVEDLVGSEPSQGRSANIEADALKLIAKASDELDELGLPFVGSTWGRVRGLYRWREPERLAKFLGEVLEPAALVLYFSVRIENGHRDPWLLNPPRPERPPDRREHRRDESAWLENYLGYLVNDGAAKGPPFPSRLWKSTGKVNYRVRYNLACMYARLGAPRNASKVDARDAALKLAIKHLGIAIADARGGDRRALTAWAPFDPALAPLRDDTRKEEFDAALLAAAAADEAKAI